MKTGIIPMTQSGAILGSPGQYKSPPFLMMPGNPVLEEFIIYDFKVNKIPEPEDINNIPDDYGKELVEVSQRTVKGYTYYCNLDADADWDDTPMWNSSSTTSEKKACLEARNMTGDGSRENPWKNLTYALEQLQCFVTAQCCHYVRIVCTGTAHYTACLHSGYSNAHFRGNNIFILDGAKIEVSRISNIDVYAFRSFSSSIFYNCFATGEANSSSEMVVAFYECSSSIFYNCFATGEANSSSIRCSVNSFYSCRTNIFYHCTAKTATNTLADSYAYGFYGCGNDSIFYNCSAMATTTLNIDPGPSESYINSYAYGFSFCDNSSFYHCSSTATTTATTETGNKQYAYAYSFDACDNNTFYGCIAITVTTAHAKNSRNRIFGFNKCDSNTFYGCKATAEATISDVDSINFSAYAFIDCNNSIFCDCSIEIRIIATTTYYYATINAYGFSSYRDCTFYNNSFSYDVNISTTPDSYGNFEERENICGFNDFLGCHDPCYSIKRTQSGITDYCNS